MYISNQLSKITVKDSLYLKKLGKTSNATFKKTNLKLKLSYQYKFKALQFFIKNSGGRNSSGQITVFSKGYKNKIKTPITNYSFRNKSLLFYSGLIFNKVLNKLSGLVLTSSGCATFLQVTQKHPLFLISRFKPVILFRPSLYKELSILKPQILIENLPFLIFQQKKNETISFIELLPLGGVKYTRSFGSSSYLLKLDTRTGLALLRLSSGLKKLVSIFSLSQAGSPTSTYLKTSLINTKSGDYRKKGLKPKVRGVAKNPVDHPHGGRTKAIKYPRSPWGKTTKFK